MKTNLFLMDMASAWSVNGVMRFIQELTNCIANHPCYCIIWVHFVHGLSNNVIRETDRGLQKIIIPLPNDVQSFLGDRSKRISFWDSSLKFLRDYIRAGQRTILHINTLNLMEFALFVKSKIPCKIVSHIHCIPWKNLYNNNLERFNILYEKYYIQKNFRNWKDYILHDYEWYTYTKSDSIICVTECAYQFIRSICPQCTSNIEVVANGIKNIGRKRNYRMEAGNIKCLFVGNSTRSKGLNYILEALEIVNMQYPITIIIAGKFSNPIRNNIRQNHPFLKIDFIGNVNSFELKDVYMDTDIGLIGSLQEQCSYVAIEMMMFGIPIVSTNADGLGELFRDGENALTIRTTYRHGKGLSVDTVEMANSIIRIIENDNLRRDIAINAKLIHQQKYTQRHMTEQILHIYDMV